MCLEEASDLVPLVIRNSREQAVGSLRVSTENGSLVFDDGKGEGVCVNVDILVAYVDPVVLWNIAEEVHLPTAHSVSKFVGIKRMDLRIEMRDSVGHTTDEVVELVGGGSVDVAVIYPLASPDSLIDFGDQLERIFYAFVAQISAIVDKVDVLLSREAENVERIARGDSDLCAARRPGDLMTLDTFSHIQD